MIVLLHNLLRPYCHDVEDCINIGNCTLLQACRDNKIVLGRLVSLVVDQKSCDLYYYNIAIG